MKLSGNRVVQKREIERHMARHWANLKESASRNQSRWTKSAPQPKPLGATYKKRTKQDRIKHVRIVCCIGICRHGINAFIYRKMRG